MSLFALHGFLGLPTDFSEVADSEWKCVDYLKVRELSPNVSLNDWGQSFNQYAQAQSDGAKKKILVGYSQGGRLALHAFFAENSQWDGLVLISTGLGIDEPERSIRYQADLEWAQRFDQNPFRLTVDLWNRQAVFQGGSEEPVREESQFNSHQLALCLKNWSVGKQNNLKAQVLASQKPILYVVGEKDRKYVTYARDLVEKNPHVTCEIVFSAGHRLIFDQPSILKNRIDAWIKKERLGGAL